MNIRQTTMEDMAAVTALYDKARGFMMEHGNPDQWGLSHPPEELIKSDIRAGYSYVCLAEGEICGVFFYQKGIEPDYLNIRQGAWLDDQPYGVVHRIAAPTGVKGVATFCLNWCLEQSGGNLRIDTHADNYPMQRMLEKNGFVRCGLIDLKDGSERIAYQKNS